MLNFSIQSLFSTLPEDTKIYSTFLMPLKNLRTAMEREDSNYSTKLYSDFLWSAQKVSNSTFTTFLRSTISTDFRSFVVLELNVLRHRF